MNQVLFKKNRLNRDKGYKINYRYDLLRYSKKQNKIRTIAESNVTSNTEEFTRQLEFRKHGFSAFENKLYALGMQYTRTRIIGF